MRILFGMYVNFIFFLRSTDDSYSQPSAKNVIIFVCLLMVSKEKQTCGAKVGLIRFVPFVIRQGIGTNFAMDT